MLVSLISHAYDPSQSTCCYNSRQLGIHNPIYTPFICGRCRVQWDLGFLAAHRLHGHGSEVVRVDQLSMLGQSHQNDTHQRFHTPDSHPRSQQTPLNPSISTDALHPQQPPAAPLSSPPFSTAIRRSRASDTSALSDTTSER